MKCLSTEFTHLVTTVEALIEGKSMCEIKNAVTTSGPRYCNKLLFKWWNDADASRQPIKSVKTLFSFLNTRIWNFLNYYILHQLVNAYGNAALKSSMKTFVSDVQGFKKMIIVEDFNKCRMGLNTAIMGYVKFEVKFATNDLTLHELEIFLEELRVTFFPSLFTNCTSCMFFHGFGEEGSIVSWLIPSELAEILKNNIKNNKSLFENFEVIHAELEENEGKA